MILCLKISTWKFRINQKKWLLLSIFLLSYIVHGISQNERIYTISGKVIDSINHDVLSFALISLQINGDTSIYTSTTTNSKGSYKFIDIPTGEYLLMSSYLGYEPSKKIIKVYSNLSNYNIYMRPSNHTLSDVIVKESKPIYAQKKDRIIYNVSSDISNSGLSTIDIFRKAPFVTIDINSKISINGNHNIQILINGKKSSLISANNGDILKQLASEDIEEIEIITNPSAKYDSEGATGIINIKTKKNTLKGLNANFGVGVGTAGSHLFGNIGYSKNKINISSSLFFNWFYNRLGGGSNIEKLVNGKFEPIIWQDIEGNSNGNLYNPNITIDFRLSEKENITISGKTYGSTFNSDYISLTNYTSSLHSIESSQLERDMDIDNLGETYELNADFTKTFKRNNEKLWILARYANSKFNINYQFEEFNKDKFLLSTNNINPLFNEEFNLQLDYRKPLSRANYIEVGAKTTFRKMKNSFSNEVFTPLGVEIEKLTESSKFNQNIYAFFASIDYTLNRRWYARLGLRTEITTLTSTNISNDSYLDIFPNILIKRTLKKGQSINLSFKRSILRPSIYYLNNNQTSIDPFLTSTGNNQLSAEYVNSINLTYSKFLQYGSLNLSSFLNYTKNYISNYSTFSNGFINTTTRNIGNKQDYGVNLWLALNIKKNFNSMLSLAWSKIKVTSSPNFASSNTGHGLTTSFNSTIRIKKNIGINVFGSFSAPRFNLQGKETSYFFYNISAQYTLKNKKGTINIGIDNPFSRYFNWEKTLITDSFRYKDETKFFNRGIRVGFNYQFGNYKTVKKRKTIREEGIKQRNQDIIIKKENNN